MAFVMTYNGPLKVLQIQNVVLHRGVPKTLRPETTADWVAWILSKFPDVSCVNDTNPPPVVLDQVEEPAPVKPQPRRWQRRK